MQQTAPVTDEYQGVVDEALQLVYSQHYRIISRLYPSAMTRVSLEQLREGPLGEDLARLAQIAGGALRAGREEVLGAIDSVLQLLFFISPIIWDPSKVKGGALIVALNPIAQLLALTRDPVMGIVPSFTSWAGAFGSVAIMTVAMAYIYTRYRARVVYWA